MGRRRSNLSFCLYVCKGGWWYGRHFGVNLNGLYKTTGESTEYDGMMWYPYPLKTVEIKIHPYHGSFANLSTPELDARRIGTTGKTFDPWNNHTTGNFGKGWYRQMTADWGQGWDKQATAGRGKEWNKPMTTEKPSDGPGPRPRPSPLWDEQTTTENTGAGLGSFSENKIVAKTIMDKEVGSGHRRSDVSGLDDIGKTDKLAYTQYSNVSKNEVVARNIRKKQSGDNKAGSIQGRSSEKPGLVSIRGFSEQTNTQNSSVHVSEIVTKTADKKQAGSGHGRSKVVSLVDVGDGGKLAYTLDSDVAESKTVAKSAMVKQSGGDERGSIQNRSSKELELVNIAGHKRQANVHLSEIVTKTADKKQAGSGHGRSKVVSLVDVGDTGKLPYTLDSDGAKSEVVAIDATKVQSRSDTAASIQSHSTKGLELVGIAWHGRQSDTQDPIVYDSKTVARTAVQDQGRSGHGRSKVVRLIDVGKSEGLADTLDSDVTESEMFTQSAINSKADKSGSSQSRSSKGLGLVGIGGFRGQADTHDSSFHESEIVASRVTERPGTGQPDRDTKGPARWIVKRGIGETEPQGIYRPGPSFIEGAGVKETEPQATYWLWTVGLVVAETEFQGTYTPSPLFTEGPEIGQIEHQETYRPWPPYTYGPGVGKTEAQETYKPKPLFTDESDVGKTEQQGKYRPWTEGPDVGKTKFQGTYKSGSPFYERPGIGQTEHQGAYRPWSKNPGVRKTEHQEKYKPGPPFTKGPDIGQTKLPSTYMPRRTWTESFETPARIAPDTGPRGELIYQDRGWNKPAEVPVESNALSGVGVKKIGAKHGRLVSAQDSSVHDSEIIAKHAGKEQVGSGHVPSKVVSVVDVGTDGGLADTLDSDVTEREVIAKNAMKEQFRGDKDGSNQGRSSKRLGSVNIGGSGREASTKDSSDYDGEFVAITADKQKAGNGHGRSKVVNLVDVGKTNGLADTLDSDVAESEVLASDATKVQSRSDAAASIQSRSSNGLGLVGILGFGEQADTQDSSVHESKIVASTALKKPALGFGHGRSKDLGLVNHGLTAVKNKFDIPDFLVSSESRVFSRNAMNTQAGSEVSIKVAELGDPRGRVGKAYGRPRDCLELRDYHQIMVDGVHTVYLKNPNSRTSFYSPCDDKVMNVYCEMDSGSTVCTLFRPCRCSFLFSGVVAKVRGEGIVGANCLPPNFYAR